jgi:DNA transformation protein
MAYSAEFRDHLLDLLAPLDAVARGMFGGLGLFRDGLMFGLVTDDRLYFRTDDENRPDYDAAGFGPFVFTARSGRSATMPYHEVPDDVLEDAEDLVEWGRRAWDAALRADRAKPPSARKSGRGKKKR